MLPDYGSFAVLGTGDPRYERLWRDLAASYPDRFAVKIGFDEPLAHLIEGGSRHVSDAVAIRAVRPQPDVQHALRNGADRARDRRAATIP